MHTSMPYTDAPETPLPGDPLHQQFNRAESPESLADMACALPELQCRMTRMGLGADCQGRIIAGLVDALTRRLITLAEARMTPAPGPYAWLACGSQGRWEQTVHTDQDNALAYADDLPPEADAWFQRLGEYVSDGLAACGIQHCPGGVSPRAEHWRRSRSSWRRLFRETIERPERKAVMLASHYFDLRVVHGDPTLFEPLRLEALQAASGNSRFLTLATENALRNAPALGLFGRLRRVWGGTHAGSVNLKHHGLLPITQLALNHALRGGLTPVNTLDRIRAAAEAGLIQQSSAEDLALAYTTIADLRQRHLATQIEQGQELDNFLPLTTACWLEQRQLKDALAVIGTVQKTLKLGQAA